MVWFGKMIMVTYIGWNCYDYDCEEEWFEVIPEELKINYLFYGHSIPNLYYK